MFCHFSTSAYDYIGLIVPQTTHMRNKKAINEELSTCPICEAKRCPVFRTKKQD